MTNFKTVNRNKTERGFTIVELLIVIIVIGILATLVLIAYNNVQAQARDTKRQADASTLRDAAASFKIQSTTGYYPYNTTSPAAGPVTAASFYGDLTNVNNTYPSKTVVIDQGLGGQVGTVAPTSGTQSAIQAVYCGPAGVDRTTATGMKFVYWQETKNPNLQSVSTGSGC